MQAVCFLRGRRAMLPSLSLPSLLRRGVHTAVPSVASMAHIRNLGIIAHIDAGKTTVTERMLYYSNLIQSMGEVHDGDTVMDFLPQERARGITISSAAISFSWLKHRFNLVDTPGHVDFTVEVERSLRVLDGALVILDACSGVEAQTQTVWRQADRRCIAKVVVANKLDRDGASVWVCTRSLEQRLGATPLLLYMPVGEASKLSGFVDLLCMEYVTFDEQSHGKVVVRRALTDTDAPGNAPSESTHAAPEHANDRTRIIWQDACLARERLIEALADLDDEIASAYLDQPQRLHWQSAEASSLLKASIRRQTISLRAVPVVCAAAFKNKGVQLALDAVVDYLPSPSDRPMFAAFTLPQRSWSDRLNSAPNAPLIALAFKVVHDRQRGFLTYLRVYSGTLRARDNLLNTGAAEALPALADSSSPTSLAAFSPVPAASAAAAIMPTLAAAPATPKRSNSRRLKALAAFPKERAMRLVEVFGADMADVDEVSAGNICAALGLKHVRTGDTLVHAQHAQQQTSGDDALVALAGIDAPAPVFFCAIEAESQAEQAKLDEALRCVLQEDPSLSLASDADTGQTLLRGMGELHLEIVHRRLVDDFKCKVQMGAVRVAYRETIELELQQEALVDRVVASRAAFARVVLVLRPGALGSGVLFTYADSVFPPNADGLQVEGEVDDEHEDDDKQRSERARSRKRGGGGGRRDADPDRSDHDGDGDSGGDSGGDVNGDENAAMTLRAIREAVRGGAEAALSRGTLLGYPCTDAVVHIEQVEQNLKSTAPAFRQAASQAITLALRAMKSAAGVALLEPVMAAEVSVSHAHLAAVLNDLVDRRRATIGEVQNRGSDGGALPSTVQALVPLAEMIGYASAVRSLTQGNASFTMRFHEYQKVQTHELKKLIANCK